MGYGFHADKGTAMVTVLIVILILALLGALPAWGWHSYGWAPSGGVGLVVVILIFLLAMGRL